MTSASTRISLSHYINRVFRKPFSYRILFSWYREDSCMMWYALAEYRFRVLPLSILAKCRIGLQVLLKLFHIRMVHGARHSVDLYGADIYVDWNLSAIICNPEAFSNLCSAVCIAARMKAKNVETYSKDLCRKQPATNAIILIFCRDCEWYQPHSKQSLISLPILDPPIRSTTGVFTASSQSKH